MADRLIGVEDVASGAGVVDYRFRDRGAALGLEQYVVALPELAVSFRGMVAGFRMPVDGTTGTAKPYLTIENQAGSGVLIRVRSAGYYQDSIVTSSAATKHVRGYVLTTLPTGGTVLGKMSLDPDLTSSALVVARGANAADAGAITAITAPVAGGDSSGLRNNMAGSPIEQYMADYKPVDVPDDYLIREGQAFLVRGETTTSQQMTALLAWDELTP